MQYATLIVVIIIILVGMRTEKYHPVLIYIPAIMLLYSTTLLGSHVVGSDIYGELLISNLSINGWSWQLFDPSNTSYVVGWVVPSLYNIFGISTTAIYKFLLPAVFAMCPVFLYYAFRSQIGSIKAFYASIFFIIMPVFFLEIATIGKSMVAESFMALGILMLSTKQYPVARHIILFIATVLCVWAHYTVGIIWLFMLSGIVIARLFGVVFRKWGLFHNKSSNLIVLTVILVMCMMSAGWYYSTVADGFIARTVTFISEIYTRLGVSIYDGKYKLVTMPENIGASGMTEDVVIYDGSNTAKQPVITVKDTYLDKQPLLIRTALGLDFFEVGIWGKIFRIIQYITQLLIIIGCLRVLFIYKKYNFTAEFVGGIGSAFAILLLCIFVPSFASIINATRFYHLALFFLSPMLVVGCDVFGYKPQATQHFDIAKQVR